MTGLLTDYTFQTVALGSALLGMISGVLGTFAVLQKKSLLGDGVSHAALPGVVLAFMISGNKSTEVLLLGAFLFGLLATLFILGIVRYTRIQFDSALALIMSVFFGVGMVLLTRVQKQPHANQAGLSRFILGQASALLQRDVWLMFLWGLLLFTLVLLFWKELKLYIFDGEFAHSMGFSPKCLNVLLSFMMVMGIIIGLQAVGVIFMSAMLIAPGVAARQWTNQLGVMLLLSAVFGAGSGLLGTLVSSLVPKLPTGPAIVIFASFIVTISVLVAPGRGLIYKLYRRRKQQKEGFYDASA